MNWGHRWVFPHTEALGAAAFQSWELIGTRRNFYEFPVFIGAPSRAGGSTRGFYEARKFVGIKLITTNYYELLGITRNS